MHTSPNQNSPIITIPEIMNAPRLLSRFIRCPSQIQYGATNRLLQYPRENIDSQYKSNSNMKSTSEYASAFGSRIFSGSTKKQFTFPHSYHNCIGESCNRHYHSTTMLNSSSKVIRCKAAVCRGAGEPVTVEEIEVEPPKASEVRVKMIYASLCHTDILCSKGLPFPVFPRVLGHEGVGMVESVGEGVTNLKEGDLVIPTFLGECQECENCKSGKTNVCNTHPMPFTGLMPDNTSRMSLGGQKLYHLFSCSTWSEYTVINVNYITKIDPRMPLAHASFISCGFTTGLGGPWKEGKVEQGSTVAVFGLGAVGLGAVEGARIQGASKIIGIDKNEKKGDKGKVFGMTHFINPDRYNKSISEVVKDLTGGSGADCCIECTGAAPLVNEALEATKAGKGTMVLIGAGSSPCLEVTFSTILMGRTLKGSVFGGIKTRTDLPIVVDKCINKEIQLDELLTHEISLDEVDKAFDLLKQPDCVKVLIKI